MRRKRHMSWEQWFWMQVSRGDPEACWPWIGSRNCRVNRGIFWFNGRSRFATHIMWLLTHGMEVPDGKFVLHKCDNPICVNPSHLHLGTKLENMREAVDRNRVARGERHGRAKLTKTQVAEIRRLWSEGKMSQSALARQFGISNGHTCLIVHGKTWIGAMES